MSGMSAMMSAVQEPVAPEEAETTARPATGVEILTVAIAGLVLMTVEALRSKPRILFDRYFFVDEMWAKFLESDPSIWHSLVTLKHSPDLTPPVYHLLARAFWTLWGGSPETAFRILSFITMWIALVLTYAVLRRSFAILPALIAVLASWSYPTIITYAFFARPYALLLASTAGFCLIYGEERTDTLWAALTAAAAALVCISHYFGIFGLASIVFVDIITRPVMLGRLFWRLLPVAAGPIALLLFVPFIRGTASKYHCFSYLPPLTPLFAFKVIIGGPITGFFGSVIILAVVLVFAWGVSELIRRCYGTNPPVERVRLSRPTILLTSLLLVPLILAVFSALTWNSLIDRYMITGLLGTTPLMAMLASRSSKWVLVCAVSFFALSGAVRVRWFGFYMDHRQAGTERMIRQVNALNDRLPIVAYSTHEAYVIYSYAPVARPRLFIADFRSSHMRYLSAGTLVDMDAAVEWSHADPTLPKVVSLNDLRRMGKFHLVVASEETQVLAHPIERLSDETERDIAEVLSLHKLTGTGGIDSLYEAEGN